MDTSCILKMNSPCQINKIRSLQKQLEGYFRIVTMCDNFCFNWIFLLEWKIYTLITHINLHLFRSAYIVFRKSING